MNSDEKFIRRCFELARQGMGFVSPNPLVGVVIVQEGRIIGEGWHERYGQAHAEVNAFLNAREDVSGATLYCNLEPCCHIKKQTPPCVPLIISKKIVRVVISNHDPNPQVAGKGVERLRQAGIQVESGLLENEGEYLNRFYFTSVKLKRPYITVKIAQSLDGRISAAAGRQSWLTGEESRKFVHELRAGYDAVLIGANTVTVDDPQLTVRLTEGRNPLRIVLDANLSSPCVAQIFKNAPGSATWVFCGESVSPEKIAVFQKQDVTIKRLPVNAYGRIELCHILSTLHHEKITSLLIEGGQSIFSQFIGQGIFDELIILQAPIILGKGISSFKTDWPLNFKLQSVEKIGVDVKLVYSENSDNFLCEIDTINL